MAISAPPSNLIPFPGHGQAYAQSGPYEYDNRAFRPEDMDEYSQWLGALSAEERLAA